MKLGRVLIIAAIAALLGAYFVFDLGRYLSLEQIKESMGWLRDQYSARPLQVIVAYFVVYVAVTALSIPGAAVMTLAGGALFGLLSGTVIISFASTVGATLAFLATRYLLRDLVQQRFGRRLQTVNAGIEKDGPFYLLTLRLVPVFPFFIINLAMALTPIRARTFYWISQVGMLPGTLVYVNAGTQLAQIENLAGILSPSVLVSFALLAAFPWIAKLMVAFVKARRVYARWSKPRVFDRNLIVIGAGAAGLVSAYIGAAVKAKVTLIEGNKMGGDCLNFGCVPSKALLRTAKFLHQARHAAKLGIASADTNFEFADVMERVQRVVRTVEPHDSAERYTKLGVDVIQGHARITSPWTVEVNGRTLRTRAIIIAAGAEPLVPPIPGLRDTGYYTSDTIWSIRTLPRRLIVLGGGPIGCEMAQAFVRFGAEVTQVEMLPRLLIREDPEVSEAVTSALTADGVRVLTGHAAVRCEQQGGTKRLVLQHDGRESAIEFDALLCAVGRMPRTEGYGLEKLGVPLSPRKTIETDDYLQTLYPNIYACGDVAGPFQFTHTAAHQAWYASVNALFGSIKRFKADYSVVPWCTFTDPEVARVGLSEQEAKQQNIPYESTRYGIDDLDRAIADETAQGFVKVLTVPGKDRILGVTIVGAHAGDLLAEYVLAMRHGLGLNNILRTIHIYPTLAEANKYVAGEWRRAHAPRHLLHWLARYHAWRRNERFTLKAKTA